MKRYTVTYDLTYDANDLVFVKRYRWLWTAKIDMFVQYYILSFGGGMWIKKDYQI